VPHLHKAVLLGQMQKGVLLVQMQKEVLLGEMNKEVVHVVMQLVKELVTLAALHLHLCQFKQHKKLIGLS
jgi:hypothetical protein